MSAKTKNFILHSDAAQVAEKCIDALNDGTDDAEIPHAGTGPPATD